MKWIELVQTQIPMYFLIALVGFLWSFSENLSLIPLLGLVSCLYMMADGTTKCLELDLFYNLVIDWMIYFGFSRIVS
jgi:hypothetical protein